MNRNELISDLAAKWMQKADRDLLSAERELSFSDPVTESVCFHSQQAAEKYLKGFLVYHQVFFGKTHRILELLKLCATIGPSFVDELADADSLTDYAVAVRYPDVLLDVGKAEALDAFEMAKKVGQFVLGKMKLDGPGE